MKKIMIMMLLICNISVFAQNSQTVNKSNNTPDSKSRTLEFMDKDGSLLKREFYDLGNVKGVKCQLLIISDMVNNKKMGCLRLETTYYNSYSSNDEYVGTLDYDEIDACLKSLHYISDTILPSTPTNYTEISYKSRDGVDFGAYWDSKKNKWTAYIYTKSYTTRSAEFFDTSNIGELIKFMDQAKIKIQELIK